MILSAHKPALSIWSYQNTFNVIATSRSRVAKVILATNKNLALFTDDQTHHLDSRHDSSLCVDTAQKLLGGRWRELFVFIFYVICQTLVKVLEGFIFIRRRLVIGFRLLW